MATLDAPEVDALERLLREWQVTRVSCSPLERLGFYRLKKNGRVRIQRGVYYAPKLESEEEFNEWFKWFEVSLGIRES